MHGGGASDHGLDDVLVPRAAADISLKTMAHLALCQKRLVLGSATAVITMPGVQKPHCRP